MNFLDELKKNSLLNENGKWCYYLDKSRQHGWVIMIITTNIKFVFYTSSTLLANYHASVDKLCFISHSSHGNWRWELTKEIGKYLTMMYIYIYITIFTSSKLVCNLNYFNLARDKKACSFWQSKHQNFLNYLQHILELLNLCSFNMICYMLETPKICAFLFLEVQFFASLAINHFVHGFESLTRLVTYKLPIANPFFDLTK